jgi:hypothetical protein
LPRREAVGAVVPHHFIRRGSSDWDDPAQLVGSLHVRAGRRYAITSGGAANGRMLAILEDHADWIADGRQRS